ncbi:MAG: thiamine phosphate synthase [Solirubrobacteraceae bacterium]
MSDRQTRLQRAVLYLVCPGRPGGRALEDVLGPALAGGVDIVQLRDKEASRDELLAAAAVARRLCDDAAALLILNDRADLVVEAQADGCHIGQDDIDVAEARALAGDGAIIGQSTHFPDEIDAASTADYIGVGPVHATPTKPGRSAVGLELVRFAAAYAPVPFFAIGGIDASNAAAVADAGARRIAVVRATSEAADPRAAAAELRGLVWRETSDGVS